MHAVAQAPEPVLTRQLFTDATARVNTWRGRCLDAFTRAETAVTETLAVMSAVEGRGGQVGLPHLVGQRLEALKVVIQEGGAFHAEGSRAALILSQFSQHLGLRNMLCHGIARVTLDVQGQWTVVMRLATLRSR